MPEADDKPDRNDRRNRVLDAALTVMARDGLRGVTHRSVAGEMGTSVRAATYYFSSIDELIEAAFLRYVERALVRFEGVRTSLPPDLTVDDAAAALTMVVAGDVVGDRDGLVAEYILVLEMARRPALEEAYAQWQEALESMLREYAQALGSKEPELHARLVLATLRGLEIEALARPSRDFDSAYVQAAFRALLGALPQ